MPSFEPWPWIGFPIVFLFYWMLGKVLKAHRAWKAARPVFEDSDRQPVVLKRDMRKAEEARQQAALVSCSVCGVYRIDDGGPCAHGARQAETNVLAVSRT